MTTPQNRFHVKAEWDAEAGVWYTAETDVPGLATEAATLEELAQNIRDIVPELIELNSHLIDWSADDELPVSLTAHREMKICA